MRRSGRAHSPATAYRLSRGMVLPVMKLSRPCTGQEAGEHRVQSPIRRRARHRHAVDHDARHSAARQRIQKLAPVSVAIDHAQLAASRAGRQAWKDRPSASPPPPGPGCRTPAARVPSDRSSGAFANRVGDHLVFFFREQQVDRERRTAPDRAAYRFPNSPSAARAPCNTALPAIAI